MPVDDDTSSDDDTSFDDDTGGCGTDSCLGCCENETCQPGDQHDACGFGGAPCEACLGDENCVIGACTPVDDDTSGDDDTEACWWDNCLGCCENDTCQPGDTNDACGFGGVLCVECLPSATCVAGWCRLADDDTGSDDDNDTGFDDDSGGCGPETCLGCCAGAECQSGDQPDACGFGGAPCEACSADEECVLGTCTSVDDDDDNDDDSGETGACCVAVNCEGYPASACGDGIPTSDCTNACGQWLPECSGAGCTCTCEAYAGESCAEISCSAAK
jgi:hypothetical protein